MLSKAFHAFAFFRGFPSQIDFITKIQRPSITRVITVSKTTYFNKQRVNKEEIGAFKDVCN